MLSIGPHQRHAQVAIDSPVDQDFISRKLLADAGWMMAKVAFDNAFAGRADQIPLDRRRKTVRLPITQRACAILAGELCNQRIAGAHRAREMLDQRVEEIFANRTGSAL